MDYFQEMRPKLCSDFASVIVGPSILMGTNPLYIVMENLTETYPCNGGAFFWVVNDDTNGHWSKPVKEQLDVNSMICSNS